MSTLKTFTLAGLLFFFHHGAIADLIFSAPPRGSEAEERKTYEPLVKAMSEVTGVAIKYVHPRDFIEYSVNMQKGNYDIVFDGPHFSQWRVANLDHTILVNLPESLQFYVIVPREARNIKTLHDLIYSTVCAQMTPQLGTLQLLQNYAERAVEPELHLVRGEEKVMADFTAGKCKAAVLRDKRFYKFTADEQAAYSVIYKTQIAPNDAITVNRKLNEDQRKALVNLLTNPAAMQVAAPVFERFSRDAVAFKRAEPEKFKGLDKLLLLSFGWDVAKSSAGREAAKAEIAGDNATPSLGLSRDKP